MCMGMGVCVGVGVGVYTYLTMLLAFPHSLEALSSQTCGVAFPRNRSGHHTLYSIIFLLGKLTLFEAPLC